MRLTPCLALLVVVASAPVRAEGPTREQAAAARYGQGVESFKAGDMPQALIEFEAAYALVPRFEALFNIGVAHRRLGHYAAAYNAFLGYLAQGADRVSEERKAQVAEALLELEPRVAHVTVEVEGPPAEVEVDGRSLGASPVPTQHLAVGRHEFRASRAGCAQALDVRVLAAGQVLSLPLRPVPLSSNRPPPRVRLAVESTPPGALLEIDEQPVGAAPWSGELRRGRHLLQAELPGYLPQTVKLDLQGAERTVQLELAPKRWYHRWYVWTAVGVVVTGAAVTTAVLVTR